MEFKTYPDVHGKIPAHLPKRLTISFPIWGLEDTSPEGAYHDLDKMVREHVERGFNCIRLESGAGLVHDLDGNRLPPPKILQPFPGYSDNRQAFCIGGEGHCDLLQRLIDLCTACKKYDVYVILSSWYFLHTYWYSEESANDRNFAIAPEDRFMAFAKYLHYILRELEERGLADRVASAEIFNEVNDLTVHWAFHSGKSPAYYWIIFREKHEEALDFLQKEHPNILFSCDDTPRGETMCLNPRNMQVFNGHNYFLWDVYGNTLEEGDEKGDYFLGKVTMEDLEHCRDGRKANSSYGWYVRLKYCHDIDPEKVPAMEEAIEARLNEKWDNFAQNLENSIYWYKRTMKDYPDVPVMCGEGVTYCSSKIVLWEEKSQRFWEMVEHAMKRYKEIGMWGSVVKTCCGPEDPCWTMCKDKLLELNMKFLKDE